MSNSSLVNYIKISPNKSIRKSKIDTITIHHMAGNLTVEACGNTFSNSARQASSNYGVGTDGRIGLYVGEDYRSWCSSNKANDDRAITIEVANDGGAPDWHVSDAALNSLIKLCADICQRNDIKELKWSDNKSLVGQIDKQNITIHQWFAATACPGPYLHSKIGYVAEEANKILGVDTPITPINDVVLPKAPFTIKVLTGVKYYATPVKADNQLRGTAGKGTYTITETNGSFGKLKSGAGWADLSDTTAYEIITSTVSTTETTPVKTSNTYQVVINVKALNVRKGPATSYGVSTVVYKGQIFTITETQNNWGKLKSGAGWICLDYVTKK